LTDLLEIKSNKDNHALNVWIFYASCVDSHMLSLWNLRVTFNLNWFWTPTLKVIRQIIFGLYWCHVAPNLHEAKM
jgi:hypothetical protein